jgi:hypothetical protein
MGFAAEGLFLKSSVCRLPVCRLLSNNEKIERNEREQTVV